MLRLTKFPFGGGTGTDARNDSRYDRGGLGYLSMDVGSQPFRCWLYTACVGPGNIGSAKQPTATAMAVGFRDGYQKTVEPHVPQKWNVIGNPLSVPRWYDREVPMTSVELASKKAATPKGLPVRR
jgi:hypothetical protein